RVNKMSKHSGDKKSQIKDSPPLLSPTSKNKIWSKRPGAATFAFLGYMVFALFLTWPLILSLNGFVLTKDYPDISHSDTMLHISHVKEARALYLKGVPPLIVDSFDVAQTYIIPGILITSYLPVSDIMYHNLFFLACVVLSGFCTFLFVRYMNRNVYAAFLGGFLYMSSNLLFRAYVWGHTNLMQFQWIPLIFLFVEKVLQEPSKKHALFLGVVGALQLLSSAQYTAYLSFILPLYLGLRTLFFDCKCIKDTRVWKLFLLAAGIALLLSVFYLVPRMIIPSTIRTIEENLNPWWRLTSIKQLFWPYDPNYLGSIHLLLMGLGSAMLVMQRGKSEFARILPFALLTPFLILGMNGPSSPVMPYYLLYKYWPMINHFRVPARLFPFVLLCGSMVSSSLVVYLGEI
ncbi:hypothetical protein COY95_04980, partial [Candidatus Woesearchaeota archaeon CG_4_10_14_0_8_um_filter_47_5]